MKIYFVLPAKTIYEQQSRVCGWRHTPASRDSLRELRDLVPRLRELGATKVISSDLDEQSAALLGRRLNVPVELWQSLRRFNVGKHHGMKSSKFEELWRNVQDTWRETPNVPMQGGDSWTSYMRRLSAAKERVLHINVPVVIMVSEKEMANLIGATVIAEHNHIYEWDTEGLKESPSIYKETPWTNGTAKTGTEIGTNTSNTSSGVMASPASNGRSSGISKRESVPFAFAR